MRSAPIQWLPSLRLGYHNFCSDTDAYGYSCNYYFGTLGKSCYCLNLSAQCAGESRNVLGGFVSVLDEALGCPIDDEEFFSHENLFSLLVCGGDRKGLEAMGERLCPGVRLDCGPNSIWLRTRTGQAFLKAHSFTLEEGETLAQARDRAEDDHDEPDEDDIDSLEDTVAEARSVAADFARRIIQAWRSGGAASAKNVFREGPKPVSGAVQPGTPLEEELTKLLLAFGGDLLLRSRTKRNALHEASATGSGDVVSLLLAIGAPLARAFQSAAPRRRLGLGAYRSGAPQEIAPQGTTPLGIAARAENDAALRVLVPAIARAARLSVGECLAAEILSCKDPADVAALRRAASLFAEEK